MGKGKLMKTEKIHINQIKVGDKVLMFGDLVAIITGTQITGKGHQRIFGYYEGEPNNLGLIEGNDCYLSKVI